MVGYTVTRWVVEDHLVTLVENILSVVGREVSEGSSMSVSQMAFHGATYLFRVEGITIVPLVKR